MFLVICDNSNLDVLINFVLIKKKKCITPVFFSSFKKMIRIYVLLLWDCKKILLYLKINSQTKYFFD